MSNNPIAVSSFQTAVEVSKSKVNALVMFFTLIIALLGQPTFVSADTSASTMAPAIVATQTLLNPRAPSSPYSLYPTPIVTPQVMQKWLTVAWCETNQHWASRGPIFSGGLGITNYNWAYFGGRDFAQNASQATPEQQVLIAIRIQKEGGYKGVVPDQNGYCAGW